MVKWHEIADWPKLSSVESPVPRLKVGLKMRLPSVVLLANSGPGISVSLVPPSSEEGFLGFPGLLTSTSVLPLVGWPFLLPLSHVTSRETCPPRPGVFVTRVIKSGVKQHAIAPGLPCKTRASSIWLERPEATPAQNTEFRLKCMNTQHKEIMSGKTPGPFPIFAGYPLYINGKIAPRAIPDTVAVKQPADPKKDPKVRFCRNATADYTLNAFAISWLREQGLSPTEFGFDQNSLTGDWEAPSLNDTVDPRHSTISFPMVLDLAAMTLLCWMLSLLDWKGAFRQISLSPEDYYFSYYVLATCWMLFAGFWVEMELVALESRLYFGGAAATSSFSVFPIVHCLGSILAERKNFNKASPDRQSKWRWAYSIRRMGPCAKLPRGNRCQDFGLAQVPESFLPRPKIKVKNGKRIFPMRPRCSQALQCYRAFRLNHSIGSFLNYVDDAVFGGNGLRNTSSHEGDFNNFIEQGKSKKNIVFAESEAGKEGKVSTAQAGEPVTFGGIKMYPQPFPRLGLPDDKRLQYIALIILVLDMDASGQVPFTLLETLLGKLSWWANVDKQIWCYMVPLQWHCAWFTDLFEMKPTDPRTLFSPGLSPLVRETLGYLLKQLQMTGCWVSSYVLVHLPLLDGCIAFISDAAGAHEQGIGLLLLGKMSKYCKTSRITWKHGGDLAFGVYPTMFEKNLRQNAKEMLGVFLGALRWASLAKRFHLPLLVVTDNTGALACMTVHSTIRKARSGSYRAGLPRHSPS